MNSDLNNFIDNIFQWKKIAQKKDYKIESLQNVFSQSSKRNEVLENTRSCLLNEVSELNEALATLQKSFTKLDDYEEEKKNLLKEKQELLLSLESYKKQLEEQNRKIEKEREQLKKEQKCEIEKALTAAKNEGLKNQKNLQEKLEAQEKCISDLKLQIIHFKAEKDQELLKLKIQYEEKIGKLKQQVAKSKLQGPPGAEMHDIFRQKYLRLEKESSEEIAKLKEELKMKDSTIESLKSKNITSPVSGVILATNTQQKESLRISCKISEMVLPLHVENKFEEDGDFTCNKRKMSKIEPIQLQKKKLFNLNQNYFARS